MRVIPIDAVVLPSTFDIALNDLTPMSDYIHSMWVKRQGGAWEKLTTYFNSGPTGKKTICIPVDHTKEIFVHNHYLEGKMHKSGLVTPDIKLTNATYNTSKSPFDKGEKVAGRVHTFEPGYTGQDTTQHYHPFTKANWTKNA